MSGIARPCAPIPSLRTGASGNVPHRAVTPLKKKPRRSGVSVRFVATLRDANARLLRRQLHLKCSRDVRSRTLPKLARTQRGDAARGRVCCCACSGSEFRRARCRVRIARWYSERVGAIICPAVSGRYPEVHVTETWKHVKRIVVRRAVQVRSTEVRCSPWTSVQTTTWSGSGVTDRERGSYVTGYRLVRCVAEGLLDPRPLGIL
jgi:uncharacterized protein (DUF3084 family)